MENYVRVTDKEREYKIPELQRLQELENLIEAGELCRKTKEIPEKVKSIEDYKAEREPHIVQEVVCLNCKKRWIAVRPEMTRLIDLECPCCSAQGYTIATGEMLEDCDEQNYGY